MNSPVSRRAVYHVALASWRILRGRHRLGGTFGAILAALCLLVCVRSSVSYADTTAGSFEARVAAGSPPYTYANCRIGLTVGPDQHAHFSIDARLNAGTYADFGSELPAPGPPAAEYLAMIRVYQGGEATRTCEPEGEFSVYPALDGDLAAVIDANRGMLWIVGNEPERVGQDNICPQQYAEAYHDVYTFVKRHDPGAQVAVAGLVHVTPMRMDYLDIVWDSYEARYGRPMPVDVWTMHAYVLSEQDNGDAHLAVGADPDKRIPFALDGDCSDTDTICHAEHDDLGLFEDQVIRMRDWMAEHGQRQKPLLLTEFGILKPYHYYGSCEVEECPPGDVDGCFCDETKRTFHPARVSAFLTSTLDYLLFESDPDLGMSADSDRLVQQVLWYRLATPEFDGLGHASNLADPDELLPTGEWALTQVGAEWLSYARSITPTVNLRARPVTSGTGYVLNGGGAAVTLKGHMVNNGNVALSGPVTVTFYSEATPGEVLGTSVVTGMAGCARHEVEVALRTVLPNFAPATYVYTYVVSAGATVDEPTGDNVGVGTVDIHERTVLLPIVVRGT